MATQDTTTTDIRPLPPYSPAQWSILSTLADTMAKEGVSAGHASDKLVKALTLIEQGKIWPSATDPGLWEVAGSEGDTYLVSEGSCTCKGAGKGARGPYACYHPTARDLYVAWQKAMDPSWDPWASSNASKTAQAAPQGTHAPPPVQTDVQDTAHATDVPRGIPAAQEAESGLRDVSQGVTLGPRRDIDPMPLRHPFPALPSDLTPVPLPEGGERTRTIGKLMGSLARAQAVMRNPPFNSQGQVGNIKTQFASTPSMRNVIIPALAHEEIAMLQYVVETETGLCCYTMLGHASGEYVCLPLPVPRALQGRETLTDRGKTIGFVKRWALGTTMVLFGESEDPSQEPLQPEASVEAEMGHATQSTASADTHGRRPVAEAVPDMTKPRPEEVIREYQPQLEAALHAIGADVERWMKRGEEKFTLKREKWGRPQYEYLLQEARQAAKPKASSPAREQA